MASVKMLLVFQIELDVSGFTGTYSVSQVQMLRNIRLQKALTILGPEFAL